MCNMKSFQIILIVASTILCINCAEQRTGNKKQVAQARDSYVKAAEHSSSLKSTEKYHYPNNAYYYQLHPDTTGSAKYYGYGYGNTNKQQTQPIESSFSDFYTNELEQHEADSKTDPASILTLAYNTVTSLSWVTTGIVAIVLAPVLIPLVLSPLIFLGIIIYFIPVIKLDLNPPNGGDERSTSSSSSRQAGNIKNALNHLEATGRFLRAVTTEEECIDRFVCEIGRMTKGNRLERWINSSLEKFRNPIAKRISRSFQIAQSASNCKMLSCNPMRQFRKIVHSIKGTKNTI